MRLQSIEPVFVEFVPEKLAPGKLYISLEYNTWTGGLDSHNHQAWSFHLNVHRKLQLPVQVALLD
jgi:hypothetical protein